MVCYALTSFITGYLRGGLYAQNWYGKNWMKTNDLESIIVCIYTIPRTIPENWYVMLYIASHMGDFSLFAVSSLRCILSSHHSGFTSKWIMTSETCKFYCLSWISVLCLWLYVTTFLNPHHSHCISGFSQTSFYVGYTLMFCLGLGIICGTVGYLDSRLFVRKICRNIKCD
ncbi:unnamed protein product [Musa acuminata subsp. malaccensis]|uniref:Transmembrane 9 superfamily member n=1 Tax=Musa acuminata subsp. malaccensis TaxID=214687 RepID=A0A804KUU7_MUSAM|nr:unnamed protein product [Musa acuminata subsp. malaccensis]